jgi:hypothetical protein
MLTRLRLRHMCGIGCAISSVMDFSSCRPAVLQEHLDGVRTKINDIAVGWSREEKDAALNETPKTFGWGGRLVQLITGGQPIGPH